MRRSNNEEQLSTNFIEIPFLPTLMTVDEEAFLHHHSEMTFEIKKSLSSSLALIAAFLLATFWRLELGPLDKSSEHDVLHLKQWLLDVSIMIFVGFGFLMTFLKCYSYSAVAFNYLASSVCALVAIIVVGGVQQGTLWIKVDLPLMIDALFTSGSAMIAFGSILGRASPTQVLWLATLLVPFYAINQHIVVEILGALDVGGSITIHAFGAFFGLSASYVLSKGIKTTSPKLGAHYVSDIFAMIGTIFLFVYWPSFNGALATHIVDPASVGKHAYDPQFMCVINTVTSLLASTLGTFMFSALADGKLNMVHIQNSTLAGGVAIGSAAALNIGPMGCILTGFAASAASVNAYKYVVPWVDSALGVKDTCGVLALHGIPGILGALVSSIAAWKQYAAQGYDYPQNERQHLYQLVGIMVTLGMAVVGGLITGTLLRNVNVFKENDPLTGLTMYEDGLYWTETDKPWEEGHEHH